MSGTTQVESETKAEARIIADAKSVAPRVVSPYLTAPEAAMYLRTTRQGIYSLVKRGRLKPMPGSGKLLFTREELDRCLQSRQR